MKFTTILLLAVLCYLAASQEKQWKRVADLPDYDDKDLPPGFGNFDGKMHVQETDTDPTKELEDIFSKLNPGANQEMTKVQYKELLKDLILGAGRGDVEKQGKDSIAAIQHKLLGSIIDEYVDNNDKETNSMQDLLQDLDQEKLLAYIDQNYKRKLDGMEL